ncbi:MAG: GAF domain-containing protein [Chloroflexota bacterium]
MRALYGISHAAARLLDAGRMADITADRLRELFGVDIVALWLWEELNGDLMPLVRSYPEGWLPPRGRLKVTEGLCGEAFSSGRLVIADDYAGSKLALPAAVSRGVLSAIAVPLLTGGRPIGSLVLGCVRPRKFAPEECEALMFVAEQLAPLAESIRLRSELRHRRAEALALADLARQGVISRDLDSLLSLLAQHTVGLLGADYATVGMVDDLDHISLQACHAVRSPIWQQPRALNRGGVTRAVLKAGKTLVLEHLDDPARCAKLGSAGHLAEGACTVLATPLPSHEGLKGALHAGWRTPYHPGGEDVRIIETLATFGAGMLDNARGQQRANDLAARLKAIIDQMPSGVAVGDAQGKLAVLNKAGREIIGLPREQQADGMSPPDILASGDGGMNQLSATALSQALSGERVAPREHLLHTYDGRQAWVRASATPLLDSAGKLAGAVAVFSDVTETKLESERRERETERGLALAAISEALGHAGRNVEAMLRTTCRALGHAVGATCAIRVLEGDELHVVRGSVHDDNPGRQRLMHRLLDAHPVPLQASRHRAVMDGGKPLRWFDSTGQEMAKNVSSEAVRKLLKHMPLFAMLVVPLHAHGIMLGTIGLYRHDLAEPFSEEDEAFASDVGARAGLGLENARLFEQLAASGTRLEELSQRMVQLAERERRAIALELHDEIGQSLTAARLLLEAARRLPTRLRDERLDEACNTLDEAVGQVRGLSLDLRPPMLDRFGLPAALEGYLERLSNRTGIEVACRARGLVARPSPEVDMAAYRIIQEGLTNVVRHSGVQRADVTLWSDEQFLWLRLSDEGKGFDPTLLEWEPSTGLTGMQERAELLGGQLTIDSAHGAGTRLLARLPLQRG